MVDVRVLPTDYKEKPVHLFEQAVAACLGSHMVAAGMYFEARVSVSGGRVVIECDAERCGDMRAIARECTILDMFSIPYKVMEWR